MYRYLLLSFVFFAFHSLGQKDLEEFYLKRSLKQEGQQFNFYVQDEDKHGVWFYSKKKFYFWYKSQKVLSTQGESSGILLNGKFEAFYPNKQLSQKGQFRKGLKNGEWLYWRNNGVLRFEENWKRGVIRSEKWYDEKGEVFRSLVVKGGKTYRESGDSTLITSKNGHSKTLFIRDKQGRIKAEERYKDNKPHGKWRTFEDGKEISSSTYKNGELEEQPAPKEKTEKSDKSEKEVKEKKEKKSFKDWFKRKPKEDKPPKKTKKEKKKKDE